MISMELLQEFSVDCDCGLFYKSHVRVIGYKVYLDDFVHIMYDGFGESVKLEKYYRWLSVRRRNELLLELGIE